MLTPGTIAPPLDLKDLANKQVPSSNFKNKVVLSDFGGTACAANPLANPMLNRLHQRYSSAHVAIVSIYTDETPGQVNKYVTSNGLLFPVYLGTRQNKKAYSTLRTPNFYLLNRKGVIIESINGYSGDLEEKLERRINNLLQKSITSNTSDQD